MFSGTSYLARQHHLLAHIHEYEQIGIRQRQNRAIQPTQGTIRPREQARQITGQRQRRLGRQRRGDESAVTRWLPDIATGAGGSQRLVHALP
ncbi:MAG: hypothetical protein ABI389_14840 [Rhodanobacter sp.]